MSDCQDALEKEMAAIRVEFKFFEEYNKLAEKNRNKVDKPKWYFQKCLSTCIPF